METNLVREEFEKYMNEKHDTRLLRKGEGYAGTIVQQMWEAWKRSHRLTMQGHQ